MLRVLILRAGGFGFPRSIVPFLLSYKLFKIQIQRSPYLKNPTFSLIQIVHLLLEFEEFRNHSVPYLYLCLFVSLIV